MSSAKRLQSVKAWLQALPWVQLANPQAGDAVSIVEDCVDALIAAEKALTHFETMFRITSHSSIVQPDRTLSIQAVADTRAALAKLRGD